MYFSLQLKEAFTNVLVAKLRSFLAILGVLVGTASVVALVSSGQLATQHALEQFKTLGTDLLSVNISDDMEDRKQKSGQVLDLTPEDAASLASLPNIVDVAPYTMNYYPPYYHGKRLDGNIIGMTQSLAHVAKINLASGRFISYLDKNEFYCVLGYNLAQELKKMGVNDPIGKQILVGNYFFTVVGTVKKWPENSFMYTDINHSLMIPISTSLLLSKYTKISSIIFKIKPDTNVDTIQKSITKKINVLTQGNHLYFRSPKEIITSMENQRKTFTLLLGLIGSISLLVGGIGVMNIMLVSVVERRREIGIRLAVGAKRKDIQLMFLIESVALTLFGGLLGVIVGILTSFIITLVSHWHFQFFMMPPLIGFIVSVLVGIFFGFYPAYQASRLDPIQTLRSD